MPSLQDPGFELGVGWSYIGLATRTTDQAYAGSYSAELRSRKGSLILPDGTSQILSETLTVTDATEYALTIWVYPATPRTTGVNLEIVTVDGNGATTVETITATDLSDDTWTQVTTLFTTSGTSLAIRIRSIFAAASVYNTVFYVDSVSVTEGDVAIKLSERAVDAVVSTLQTNLGTELAAIDTERGDGVTLTVPASGDYHKRPKAVIEGSRVQIEVYEEGFSFDHPYSDMDAERAVFDVPIVIRLTCFNENGETADVMRTRMRRYTAGIYNTVIRNPRLGASDDAIQHAVLERTDWDIEAEGDSVTKVQVAMDATVKCEEVYA